MYNFSVTAALKAWIDLVCRVGETFVYGENGPEGLLT
jgi:FMN-dependent NADH-azoreductase